MQKYTKNAKKTQKNAKIFAHIKKKYYLCIEIKKQDGAATRNSGKKVMTTRIKNYTEKNDGREIIIEFVTNDPNAICRIVEGYYVKYWGRKNNQLYIKRFNTEAEALKFANKVLKK